MSDKSTEKKPEKRPPSGLPFRSPRVFRNWISLLGVLLVGSSGGSGSFVYLAVVGLLDGEPVNLATTLVGDRERVEAISVEDARVRLDLLVHGPDDPACCPSRPVSRAWVLNDGRLSEVAVTDAD